MTLKHTLASFPNPDLPKHVTVGDLTVRVSMADCLWKGTRIKLQGSGVLTLELLARYPEFVFSRNQIMDAWKNYNVTDRAVDSVIKRLRRNLRDVDPNLNPIRTVYGFGYALDPDRCR